MTVTSFIAAFQLFDLVIILTGGATGVAPGGPGGTTRTIVLYLYEQTFLFSERISGLGYGATIGWMLAILIFIVTLAQFRFARSTVFFLTTRIEHETATELNPLLRIAGVIVGGLSGTRRLGGFYIAADGCQLAAAGPVDSQSDYLSALHQRAF